MKALSGALVTLVVLLAGLSAAPPAAAEPYPHSVETICRSVPKPKTIHLGDKVVARFGVRVVGTVRPKTWLRITAVKAGAHRTVWTKRRFYRGQPRLLQFSPLPRGNYSIRFQTSFGPESVFKNCRSRFLMHVVR